eukprot:scaffold2334_cov118-Cylindrotheca_fusiformis.AAC.14
MTIPSLQSVHSKDEKPKQGTATKTPPANDDGHSHEVSGETTTAAVFGIVKAMVGPAILYLPHSFADAGYAFAIIALWICTCLYLYTAQRLLGTWRYVKSQRTPKPRSTRGRTEIEMTSLVVNGENPNQKAKRRPKVLEAERGESVDSRSIADDEKEVVIYDFEQDPPVGDSISYPQLARIAYGDIGENTVRAGITLMQLGVCLTYFIFVPHNLSASIFMLTKIHLPMWLCLVGMVAIEIPLSSIRNVSKLVTTNVIATCLIAFGLASCLFLATFNSNDQEHGSLEVGSVENDTLDSSQQPDDLWNEDSSFPKTSHMSPWNDHWYLFIGTSAFGDDVSTVLTTSLPDGALATMVQLAYSIAVIFTFPLQIFPALEIIVQGVELRLQGDSEIAIQLTPWQRRIVCTVVIALLSIIAVVEMDNLGKVVALMGSLLGCPLAFVFPPLIHSKIVPTAPQKHDYAVAGVGMLAMIGATLITLATWSEVTASIAPSSGYSNKWMASSDVMRPPYEDMPAAMPPAASLNH